MSAADGNNVDALERLFLPHLPEGEPLYPPDYLTDQPERFFVAEIVREQVLQHTHDELPFSTAVVVDKFEEPDADGPDAALLHDPRRARVAEADRGRQGRRDDQGDRHRRARGARSASSTRACSSTCTSRCKSEWREDERMLDELGLPTVADEAKPSRRRTFDADRRACYSRLRTDGFAMAAQRRIDLVLDSVKRLLRIGATANLLNLLQKQHPADLAQIFSELPDNEREAAFSLLVERNGRLAMETRQRARARSGRRAAGRPLGRRDRQARCRRFRPTTRRR